MSMISGGVSLALSSLRKYFSASTMLPSLPLNPTALPPWLLISPTICLFSFPVRTISTISIVSSSVTRIPLMKVESFPSFLRSELICGPPPWMITGLIPMYFIMTMSMANISFKFSSVMAWPPYLITMVLP